MTTCTCTDGTCDYCVTMCWAAELEHRVGLSERITESETERMIESALADADFLTERDAEDYVKTDDLERAIEEAALDPDDYVKDRDLDDRITEALAEVDIVKDAAAGAVAALLARRDQFATKADVEALVARLEDRLNADAPKRLADVVQGLSFAQRLRLLFGRA